MLRYAGSRLLQTVPLLLLVSVAVSGVMHLAPGGPTTVYGHNPLVSGGQIASIRQGMGLDEPWPVQYLRWLADLLGGNWGYSLASGRPVLRTIAERVPATLLLMTAAFAIAIATALVLGTVSASRQHSRIDHLVTAGSLFAWSMPLFWFALLAQLVFAVHLRVVPVAGIQGTDAGGALDMLHHLLLPAVVLGLTSSAGWSRYVRSSLLDVLNHSYVTTARAKGSSARRALLLHTLPNALIPLATLIGLDIPQLFAGSVVTETIFAWPGMGRLFYDSLVARDYPVELGLLMVVATLVILGNLAADLLYQALDPRVRLGAKAAA